MSRGTIYIATGRKYVEEACRSAASLKASVPMMHVTLLSDERPQAPHFDEVLPVKKPDPAEGRFMSKVASMRMSPYDQTLFLDTDTYVCEDILDLFPLLEKFDIAVAHDVNRIPKRLASSRLEIPPSFAQFNTGVILFKASPHMHAFLTEWGKFYQTMGHKEYLSDQYGFRQALYNSSLRIATLPAEYNCRFRKPMYLDGPVRILHGRHPDLPSVTRRLNATTDRRICKPQIDRPLWERLLRRAKTLTGGK